MSNLLYQKSVEELYHILGEQVIKSIPEQWLEAWIEAEMEDDNGILTGAYIPKNNPEKINYFDPGYRAFLAFDELRSRFESEIGQPWSKAVFRLNSKNQFSLDFEYDDSRQES